MTKEQYQKLYADLNTWFDHEIEDDILNPAARPEYQDLVEEQRELGVPEREIPQKVLWKLREKIQGFPPIIEDTLETNRENDEDKRREAQEFLEHLESLNSKNSNLQSTPSTQIVLEFNKVKITISERE